MVPTHVTYSGDIRSNCAVNATVLASRRLQGKRRTTRPARCGKESSGAKSSSGRRAIRIQEVGMLRWPDAANGWFSFSRTILLCRIPNAESPWQATAECRSSQSMATSPLMSELGSSSLTERTPSVYRFRTPTLQFRSAGCETTSDLLPANRRVPLNDRGFAAQQPRHRDGPSGHAACLRKRRASVAPVRPARYAVRWTASDRDCPESRFGRIFLGTQ